VNGTPISANILPYLATSKLGIFKTPSFEIQNGLDPLETFCHSGQHHHHGPFQNMSLRGAGARTLFSVKPLYGFSEKGPQFDAQ
jgi:hypothetical protein